MFRTIRDIFLDSYSPRIFYTLFFGEPSLPSSKMRDKTIVLCPFHWLLHNYKREKTLIISLALDGIGRFECYECGAIGDIEDFLETMVQMTTKAPQVLFEQEFRAIRKFDDAYKKIERRHP